MKVMRRRPWLWVVLGIALFVALDLVFVAIALCHPPVVMTPR
jgi:hypothetical protein